MVKTLRITSIVSAVLAVVFFVLPAIFGFRSDEQVEQFLASASVIEKFKQAKGDRARSESQTSPLVKQAASFASYLNPPEPRTPTTIRRPGPAKPAPRPPTVSPKFKLIGTSIYASHPELSLALIDEPGKGLHWVRQSSKIGHLVIEQVKDGVVVVRDGQRTFELEAPRPARRSLLKGPFPAPAATVRQTDSRSALPAPGKTRAEITQVSPEEELALLKGAIDELKAMAQEDAKSDKADKALIEEFISDLKNKAMRISSEEAKRLDRLGKELKSIRQHPNRPKGQAAKIDARTSDNDTDSN